MRNQGNQLAGFDVRFKPLDHPVAFYLQIAGEDEDNFLPNALFPIWHRSLENSGSTYSTNIC